MQSSWCPSYFTKEYWYKYRQKDETAWAEAEFIIEALDLKRGDSLLDVACGWGRHVHPLRDMGIEAHGLDTTELYIKMAQYKDPQVFHLGDMRNFFIMEFNAITCMFTSFGYFPDAENQAVLDCVSANLTSGGKFLLNVRNREWWMRNPRKTSNQQYLGDRDLVHEDIQNRKFDMFRGVLEVENRYIRNGIIDQTIVPQTIRLYTLTELVQMFEKAGISIIQTYGDIDCSPYTIDSEWCVIVGEKK